MHKESDRASTIISPSLILIVLICLVAITECNRLCSLETTETYSAGGWKSKTEASIAGFHCEGRVLSCALLTSCCASHGGRNKGAL